MLKSDKIIAHRFLAGLRKSINAYVTVLPSTLDNKKADSAMMILRGLKKLCLTSYVRGKRYLLTDRMKEVNLDKCRKLLNWMKADGSVIKFYSDDIFFIQI